MGTPVARVSRPDATASVAEVKTPANWLAAIAGKLICARGRGTGGGIVEVAGEGKNPGVGKALLGIGHGSEPFRS